MRIVLTGIVLGLLVACTTSPTGRRQLIVVSDTEVNTMGLAAFEQMKANDKLSTDATKRNAVNCIVKDLVAQLPSQWQGYDWEAQVFAIDSANAFALPGGKVGVNTGLFKVATNQDQLAAVIGHEIGHVIARHSNERLSQSVLAEAGTSLVGAYVGRNASPDQVKQVVALLGAGTQVGVLLPYSRLHESEADRIGQELMAKAGFDPREAAALWEGMIRASSGSATPPRLLSTHPDPIQRARVLAENAPNLMPVYQAARAAGRTPRCS
ncbi:M48 family metallopeptidase [Xanthomonadaceae bacterium JHOS43]|nr:M48 family metallopeptidase [Xanthomonadaceae bacterium JHOS43]MCX7562010.1 M48 family metallopeptidase [Xanthomonadaceae bacterium XH05]